MDSCSSQLPILHYYIVICASSAATLYLYEYIKVRQICQLSVILLCSKCIKPLIIRTHII